MKSDVYLIKITSDDSAQRISGFQRLMSQVAPLCAYKKDEIVPVKITLGDAACVYHVSPDLVKVVIAAIKKQGAKPFLFDTSVIYQGERQNAVDYLALAQRKGFNYSQVDAPFIVADGLLGLDGKEFKIDSHDIKKVKTPSFVGMLDSLVVLSHATGHIVSGYAGAIKNVAMGMSCRSTKQVQHSSLKPSVIEKNCTACACCISICPVEAITWKDKKAFIDQKVCVGCGECLCACKFNAININWHEDPHVFCRRMVDVAQCILSKFKRTLFITFALDITKECDCISAKGEQMVVKDIGILASSDAVSLDKATMDLAYNVKKTDFFDKNKEIYEGMFEYAAAKGLGALEYNLITI